MDVRTPACMHARTNVRLLRLVGRMLPIACMHGGAAWAICLPRGNRGGRTGWAGATGPVSTYPFPAGPRWKAGGRLGEQVGSQRLQQRTLC